MPSTTSTVFVISANAETSVPKENSGLHVHPKDEFVPTCQPSQRHGSSSGYCEETEYDSERRKELKTRDSPA